MEARQLGNSVAETELYPALCLAQVPLSPVKAYDPARPSAPRAICADAAAPLDKETRQ
jgi:hypothetical protein